MVEFNAGGLVGFFATLQKISAAIVKYGKEYTTKIIHYLYETYIRLTEWVKERFRAYFIRKDLSREELEHQLHVLKWTGRMAVAFVVINVLRIAFRFKPK